MRDADRLRAQKAASTDPDRLEREARMAEEKQMTVVEIMAKAAYECCPSVLADKKTPLPWEKLSAAGKAIRIKEQRVALEAIIGWPLVNINIKVGRHVHMEPADVDLAITAVLRAILAEKSK